MDDGTKDILDALRYAITSCNAKAWCDIWPIGINNEQLDKISTVWNESAILKFPDTVATLYIKCECGAHKVGSNHHSSWCDMSKEQT